jgi:hypothetical protein
LREDAAKKERDKHFNTIQPMFPTKQECRVKEKTSTPALTVSDDDMDLLVTEPPLKKQGFVSQDHIEEFSTKRECINITRKHTMP